MPPASSAVAVLPPDAHVVTLPVAGNDDIALGKHLRKLGLIARYPYAVRVTQDDLLLTDNRDGSLYLQLCIDTSKISPIGDSPEFVVMQRTADLHVSLGYSFVSSDWPSRHRALIGCRSLLAGTPKCGIFSQFLLWGCVSTGFKVKEASELHCLCTMLRAEFEAAGIPDNRQDFEFHISWNL